MVTSIKSLPIIVKNKFLNGESKMCRLVSSSGSLASVTEAILEIDPECEEPGDSDVRRLRVTGAKEHNCKFCTPRIKKKCNGSYCYWNPEINGWGR